MTEIASDIARISDRDMARDGRLRGFSAQLWLRGIRLGEADLGASVDATMARSHAPADFVFEPPSLSIPKVANFISEQEFEGVVLSFDIETKTFWVRLSDCTYRLPEEEAEFSLEEVSVDDWPLIVPGALFSWNIGREWRDGQMRRVSEIRFRRFFRFSKAAVVCAAERASALASLIAESDAYPTGDAPQS